MNVIRNLRPSSSAPGFSAPAREVVDRAISDFESVLRGLGFEPHRWNRAACVICGSTNKTAFSFDPEAGTFHCFRCDSGGGVLCLVEAALGCDRRAALRWLADFFGLQLGDCRLSASERRKYASRRMLAEEQAADLTKWRSRTLAFLRDLRNSLYENERMASAWARKHVNDPAMATNWRWDAVSIYALDDQRGNAINALIERIEAASPQVLLAMRREWERQNS